MAEFKWTDAQRDAIEARGDILVSAAAGSGKTAVLVQRVMEMMESECDIDELLIVTFTRSAAQQMKEKIAQAIDKRLAQDPYDEHFRRQQILLEKAQITTIDAFCADVLKNNYQLLKDIDISPAYQNLDAAQFSVLSREVLDEVLDEFYERNEPSFKALMDLFTSGKNDLNIYAIIDSLHAYTSAFVDKHAWIHEKINLYTENQVAQNPWGKLILCAMEENLVLATDYARHALDILAEDAPTDEVYGEVLRTDLALYESVLSYVRAGAWDKLCAYKDYSFVRYPSVKKNIDTELSALAKPYRNAAKDAFSAAMKKVVEDEAGFAKDNALIYPVACELERLFECYEQKLFETKLERRSFEFSDISDLTLKILVDENGQPTPAAIEYQKKYKGILIDEFQDTNDEIGRAHV